MIENRIRELRKMRGLTAAKLADICGTTQATIARLEAGKRRLSDYWMERIANAMNIAPVELISRPSYAHIDPEVLEFIISEVETWLVDNKVAIEPKEKTKLISFFYDKILEEREKERKPVDSQVINLANFRESMKITMDFNRR